VGAAEPHEDEIILQALLPGPKSGKDLDEKARVALKSRGLVKSDTSKSWKYEITDAGRSITGRGLHAKPGDYRYSGSEADLYASRDITNLTSDMIKTGRCWRRKMAYIGRKKAILSCSSTPIRRHPGRGQNLPRQEASLPEAHRLHAGDHAGDGFVEIKGQIVQSSFWNFDALFSRRTILPGRCRTPSTWTAGLRFPTTARSRRCTSADTAPRAPAGRSLEAGGGPPGVLRTHTTGVTIKYLADHPEPPVKAFGIDRVYRREAIDATHTPSSSSWRG